MDEFEMPKDRSLEEILDSTDKGRIFLTSDWHILKQKYKHEKNEVNTTELISWCKNNIKDDDVFMYLGDLSYRYTAEEDYKKVQDIYKSLPGIKVLVLGNHDIQQGEEFYKDCGFDFIFYEFLYKDILFTHRPVDMILRGIINGLNIHGHIHKLSNDYDFIHPDRNINVFPANYGGKPTTLKYVLNHVGKLTKDNRPNGYTDGLTEAVITIRDFLYKNDLPVESVTETKRSNLSDDQFGIPQERKYPLDTEAHVRSAVKMFNYVNPKYEKQLAKNVIAAMKRYRINDMKISKQNRLYRYMHEASSTVLDMIPSEVDTIIFDMGKILVDDKKEQCYIDHPKIPNELAETIYKTIGRLYFDQPRDPAILTWSAEQAIDYFMKNAPEELTPYTGAIFEALPNGLLIYDFSIRLISYFKSNGYRVYYLSNWDRWSYELGEERFFKPLLDLMDGGIFSFEVGVEKPVHDIYKIIIERYGLDPKTCLFFDDREENVIAAKDSVGMHAIQILDPKVLADICNTPENILSEVASTLHEFTAIK